MPITEKGKYTSPEGSRTWEYISIFCCSVFSLCIGTVIGWNAPSVVKLMSTDSPIPVEPSDASTLVATVAVGHMLSPPLCTFAVDRIGRKNTILLSGVPLAVSWGLIMVAKSVIVLYIARFISGVALGFCICVSPMYLGEVSSTKTRGAAGTLLGVMFNLGILLAFIVGPYLSIPLMAGVFLAMSIAFMLMFWFVPESPYYLVIKGRTEEAEEVLEKLRGRQDVADELETINSSMMDERNGENNKAGIMDIFRVRANFRAFVVIFLITLMQHYGGFFVVLTYGQLIFKDAGSKVLPDHTANILVGFVQLVSAILTSFLVDKLGRKPLIMASGFLAGLCALAIGSFFLVKNYTQASVENYSLVPFIASMVLVFAFNCGLVSLQMILMSEIFATEVKAISTCVSTVISGILAVSSCKLYILVAITWGYGHAPPFLAFFLILWVSTAVILYLLPETKGKTFAQIQKEFND